MATRDSDFRPSSMFGDSALSGDSLLMNYALRMVIPLKREFGLNLDVPQFLDDELYALEILNEARTSQNPRLRGYADYIGGKRFGPRNAEPPTPSVMQRMAQASSPTTPQAASMSEEEAKEEAKRLMLAKYQSGLR